MFKKGSKLDLLMLEVGGASLFLGSARYFISLSWPLNYAILRRGSGEGRVAERDWLPQRNPPTHSTAPPPRLSQFHPGSKVCWFKSSVAAALPLALRNYPPLPSSNVGKKQNKFE